ncbi:MarR family winged helix-turn-helix transcriptional regulator [Secundilactobacillus muriivasis]
MTHDSQELIQLFGRLFQQRTFMSAVLRTSKFDQHQPNRGQIRVLQLLSEHEQLTNSDIVDELDIRPSSASALVSKLEDGGLIERHASEEDKRVMLISLTEKGHNFISAAQSLKDGVSESLFDSLSSEEQQQLAGTLRKLLADLDEKMPNWPDHKQLHDYFNHHHDFGGDFGRFGFFRNDRRDND